MEAAMSSRYIRLFSPADSCPLLFTDRVLYSFLAFRPGSIPSIIGRVTGFDRKTVHTSLRHLASVGLVHQKKKIWYANQPPENAQGWFLYPARLQHLPHWQKRLGYEKVLLPTADAPLTLRDAAVYSMLRKTTKVKEISRFLGLNRNTVRATIKELKGRQIPNAYFQRAGKHVTKPKATIDLPDDYITRNLKAVGLSPAAIKKVRPKLEGLSPDTVAKLVSEANGRYDRDKFPDCSSMLGYLIDKRNIKPVAQVEEQVRSDNIEDNACWDARIKLWADHLKNDLFSMYGAERLRAAIEKVPPYYWQDMPGPSDDEKGDQAEAKRMSLREFHQLMKGQG
jgi:hypothetical protein